MYLKKLYSEPKGLFQTVTFVNGVNFIYGAKEINDPKESLNSIGKSTFLDLLDFCLLASAQKNHNPRLHKAKELIGRHYITLEFEVDENLFLISRSFENPNDVIIGKKGEEEEVKIDLAKKILGKLVFQRDEYTSIFNVSWYRVLITFFLKIQKFKKPKFSDPIKFIAEASEVELNYIHLYLLDLSTEMALKISEIRGELQRIKPAIKEIKRFVDQKYNLRDIFEANSEIDRLRVEIKKIENAVAKFELGDQYEDAENSANEITARIKSLLFDNHVDRRKLEDYRSSIEIQDNVSPTKVANIYKQLNEQIATNIKHTLKEAVQFRKKLSESRRQFLNEIISRLEILVAEREEEVKKLEKKRADLFYFLSAKEALTDLTEAFYILSEKRARLAELEANTKILNDLLKEQADYEAALKTMENKAYDFIEDTSEDRSEFLETLLQVYNAIYVENKDELKFSFSVNKRKNKILDINLSVPDMFGKGKNQGRTLVYDIAILMHNLREESFPKFLVHDGIFDGVDKAQFIATCEFINEISKTRKIQYITTVNEEGTLNEKFGESDLLNPTIIEEEAILVLTPNKKLFHKDF